MIQVEIAYCDTIYVEYIVFDDGTRMTTAN